jgi:hypothetical protein
MRTLIFYLTRISRAQVGIFFLLILFNSCKLASDFPLTVDDIDTLSVYKAHQKDSVSIPETTSKLNAYSTIPVKDSIETVLKKDESSITLNPWTICAGVFRKKQNAKRMIEQLNHYENTYLILRDSSYLVTIGSFTTRDSAEHFRISKALTGTYLLKLKPTELLLNQSE